MRKQLRHAIHAKPGFDDPVPGVSELEEKAKTYYEPRSRQQELETAGLHFLASNYEALEASQLADQRFQPLTNNDSRYYDWYFRNSTLLQDYRRLPPDEVISTLAGTRSSKLFTEITVQAHPGSGETVVIGHLRSPVANRSYLIAQWGEVDELKTIDDLRRAARPKRGHVATMAAMSATLHSLALFGVGHGWVLLFTLALAVAYSRFLGSGRGGRNARSQRNSVDLIATISIIAAFILLIAFF
jgi:hypothetical protein